MIAKFDSKCRVTGKPIIAGETNIEKIDGVWQIADPSKRIPFVAPDHASSKCELEKAVDKLSKDLTEFDIEFKDGTPRYEAGNQNQRYIPVTKQIAIELWRHIKKGKGDPYDFFFASAGTKWSHDDSTTVRVNWVGEVTDEDLELALKF